MHRFSPLIMQKIESGLPTKGYKCIGLIEKLHFENGKVEREYCKSNMHVQCHTECCTFFTVAR